MESHRGTLLLSSPALFDANFRRTAVLLAVHNEEGAMGVVLNRASSTTVGEAVPDLVELAGHDAPVFIGGPVQPQAVLVLAEFTDPSRAALLVVGDVGLARIEDGVDEFAEAVRRVRVFAGYSGWSQGQLEGELASGDWITALAGDLDLFPAADDDLFAAALRAKGGFYRLLATMPEDPSRN